MPGCTCQGVGECAGLLLCIDGVCQAAECQDGLEGCPCGSGCGLGLECNSVGYCESLAGRPGQPCFSNRTCLSGALCGVDELCEACDPGTLGCACFTNGTCNDSLSCAMGVCATQAGTTQRIPATPKCFSPCRSSFVDTTTGEFRSCSVDGLMEGCVGDAECSAGSCVTAGAEPPSCADDEECPDFQVCIAGGCYANCDIDADCGGMMRCYRHSCRVPCSSDGAQTCPEGTHCELAGTEFGYCMPLVEPSIEPTIAVDGTFEVSRDTIDFTNNAPSARLVVTNDTPHAVDFFVRKLVHVEYTDTSSLEVRSAFGGPSIDEAVGHPMPWLGVGAPGAVQNIEEFSFRVPGNGATYELELRNAASGVPARWTGAIEVASALGTRRVSLSYSTMADGRWAGKAYYFTQFGDIGLDAWRANRSGPADSVGNAFIRKWAAVRSGLSLDELNAVISATTTGSWKWPSTDQACGTAACYLYSNVGGVVQYSTNLNQNPIPTGVVEMPVALDLRTTGTTTMSGRIASDLSLHYAGDPSIDLTFAANPSACAPGVTSACLAFVESMSADVVVGGRYRTTSSDTGCTQTQSGFELAELPWIVPGFLAFTEEDEYGNRYAYECRDSLKPFAGSSPEIVALNQSHASANPIPDGQSRRRRIELVDGMLINQTSMYLVFRETFAEDFFGNTGTQGEFEAYGLMVLQRGTADLGADDFVGHEQTETRVSNVKLEEHAACSPELLADIGIPDLTAGTASLVVSALLDGEAPTGDPVRYTTGMHYLCHSTGEIDGGPDPEARHVCPVGSDVTFFHREVTDAYMRNLPCQNAGACQDQLDAWLADPVVASSIVIEPPYRCDLDEDGIIEAEDQSAYCDDNRTDLRRQKAFYEPDGVGAPLFVPLSTAIDSAFRYKTQFQGRDGGNIAFTPSICVPGSNAVPYCYDPPAIEQITERVDCLVHVFSKHYGDIPAEMRAVLRTYLDRNFSYDASVDASFGLVYRTEGFEQLYAELLVMLGDDSYTKSFQSRFDLAGSSQRSFEGALFEPNGIDLAGVAGYEMHTLYEATQYYQMVLDRFYALSPYMWQSIEATDLEAGRRYVDAATVTSYFERVLRASTQRARAFSEIAKRYQNLNRADLARGVVQRAYTSAYLESLVLGRMMQRTLSTASPAQVDQIHFALERAATVYSVALLEMREVFEDLTDEVNYFGFTPDYIPLPALDPVGPNAFETLLSRAQQAVQVAAQREEVAINSNRSFDTDEVAFQNELTRIRNTYENQLAEICGNFVGSDGNVYPAIPKYAYLNTRAATYGDPCGLMGTGALFQALGEVDQRRLDFRSVQVATENLLEEVEIERQAARDQCDIELDRVQINYSTATQTHSLQETITESRQNLEAFERNLTFMGQFASLSKCSVGTSSDCFTAGVAIGVYTATYGMNEAAIQLTENDIAEQEAEIQELQLEQMLDLSALDCEQIMAQGESRVQQRLLGLKLQDLELLKTDRAVRLTISGINQLRNQATRLMAEQEEAEQLTINLEAARNDPNVRIYRNDAVINADRSFYDALRAAYRATKVFEYYTSQSYAGRDALRLVRLVSRGDYNLENYLFDLQEAYYGFLETAGRPDTRVDVLSLRDEILAIPHYDTANHPLTHAERVARFREALADTRWLNSQGHVSMPFATTLARLSPLTRNHKIAYVEVEIIGSDVGDTLGRVYVTQAGTGMVRPLDGLNQYYRFPERTAVVNPFFNGVRAFVPDVYRNDRLRDRTYLNTNWELVINQKDEAVNQDIDLGSLTDVRLYVYYTDFTEL